MLRTDTLFILGIALLLHAFVPDPAVAQDSVNLQTYGIVILRAEKTKSTHRSLPEPAARRQHELLEMARAHPNEFNYPWTDWKTGEVVIDTVTDAAALRVKQLDKRPDVKQRVRTVKYSWADLDVISDDIVQSKRSGLAELDAITEIELDSENNRLVLVVERVNEGLLQTLSARYPTDSVAVRLGPKRKPEALVGPAIQSSASTIGPPWESRTNYSKWRVYGGSVVNATNKTCTNGFSWYYGGSIYGMITAGHCFPQGDHQIAGTPRGSEGFGWVWGGHWENWDAEVGTVPFNAPLQGGHAGDLASIQMEQYSLENANVFTGLSSYRPVKEMSQSATGLFNSVCTGGAVSGQLCDFVVEQVWIKWIDYFDDLDQNHGTAREVHRAARPGSECPQKGDSGAPVYYIRPQDNGIMAKGILSGKWYDSSANKCYVWFSDIWTVKWTFGGNLHTQ